MTGNKGNRIEIFMGKDIFGPIAWSVCMATTGLGLIYFNLLNLFNLYNLRTSLPLSACSARHPHSSRPFVICCTAQSTFLPISRFPALSPPKSGRGALSRLFPTFPGEESNSCTVKKTICVNSCGQNRENNLCQFSRGWRVDSSRKEPEGAGGAGRKRKPLTLPTNRV